MQTSDSLIQISLDEQSLRLIDKGRIVCSFPISSSRKGMGTKKDSNRTPTGRFAIARKIGAELPAHTIFRGRIPVGHWDGSPSPDDLILTRILWLDGMDQENQNTRERFIYLHGTNHESDLGTPASHGCIRMSNADIMTVFDWAEEGTEVLIQPATKPRGKLCFIDCDSTLSRIEGIDELARARGPETLAKVEALTNAAMNGEIPIAEVFPRRMDLITPDRTLCEEIALHYVQTITEGAAEFVAELQSTGWTPVILSGGFAPLIEPLARHLGIRDVEAVPLWFEEDGSYAGFDNRYPTTRNHGKNEIIREWKSALLPIRTMMIGDGVSDLETAPDVDHFIGFGGVVERPPVKAGSPFWLDNFHNRSHLRTLLDESTH